MEITMLGRALPWPRVNADGIQFSLVTLLGFYITVGAVILTLAVTILARREAPADPFSVYLDILPGKPRSAVIERGFACETCAYRPTSGAFSRIVVVVANGSIVSATFTARENQVTVGDLVLLWGTPNIQSRGRFASLNWSSPGAVVSVILPQNRRLPWFLPVSSILVS